MEIILADVKDNVDIFKTGRFIVQFENYPLPVEVKYVSPYVTPNNKGFFAIPEIGTQVLICKPNNKNDWFYLGSLLEPNIADSIAEGKVTEDGLKDPFVDAYKSREVVPQKYMFSSPKGNKLVLSDAYSPIEENKKVMLESSQGMKVELNDSIGAVLIRNSTGRALIEVTDDNVGTNAGGTDSISAECTGNVFLTSRGAELNITVVEGTTLNIINSSTGVQRLGPNDPTPGNINIISDHGDINIEAKGENQSIRLASSGNGGDIILDSKDTISLNAVNGVFISSSDGNINITGDKIYLN